MLAYDNTGACVNVVRKPSIDAMRVMVPFSNKHKITIVYILRFLARYLHRAYAYTRFTTAII